MHKTSRNIRTGKLEHVEGKLIGILVDSGYEEREYNYLLKHLEAAGAKVSTISGSNGKFSSNQNSTTISDETASGLRPDRFEAIVIPGGKHPAYLQDNKNVLQFVRNAARSGVILAAISNGIGPLAAAKTIQTKRIAAPQILRDQIIHAGGYFEDKAVIRDGRIITSRSGTDLSHFFNAIIDALIESAVPAQQK